MNREGETDRHPEELSGGKSLSTRREVGDWAIQKLLEVTGGVPCRICLVGLPDPLGTAEFEICSQCPVVAQNPEEGPCPGDFNGLDPEILHLKSDQEYFGRLVVFSDPEAKEDPARPWLNAVAEEATDQLKRLAEPRAHRERLRPKVEPLDARTSASQNPSLAVLLDHWPGMAYRCRCDSQWTMELVSSGCRELTGYAPSELVMNRMKSYADLVHPEDRELGLKSIERALEDRSSFEIEYRLITAQGEVKHVWERGHGVYQGEELCYLEGFIADVSTQKKASEELKRSEHRFRTLYDHLNQGIIFQDLEGRILDANQPALDLLGVERGELLELTRGGSSWPMIQEDGSAFSPEDLPSVRALKTGQLVNDVVVGVRNLKTRSMVWLSLNAIPDFGPDNSEPKRVIITLQDVTRRLREGLRLRQMDRAIEQSPVSVMITDLKARIQYVNPRFSAMTGYSSEEALGRNPRFLKSGMHGESFYRELWQSVLSGEVWQGELQNKRKDGTLFWERASISGVKDDQGEITHFIALKEDITAQKQMEIELVRQERLAAVGQLAAGIAHDFNNMLTTIIGHADLLQMSSNLSVKQREDLELIVSQGRRASQLTGQILDFSRQSVREPKPLDLKIFLNETMKFVERTISETVQVHFHYSPGHYSINGDPTQIQQVITNLAVNARDAMPHGGDLTFELGTTEEHPDPEAQLEVGETQWVKLQVSDTGDGIPLEVLAHIFEPFFTTKKIGEGTGLGLAQVYGIVQQHEGFIQVSSEVGVGTTFVLHFPSLPDAIEKEQWESVDIPLGEGQIVLLIEDERSVREVTQSMLEVLNYQVLIARDGEEGLRVYSENSHRIGAILSDMVMPNMGGIDFVEALVQKPSPPRVVLMSGYPLDMEVTSHLRQNIVAMLKKPMSLHDLGAALRTAVSS